MKEIILASGSPRRAELMKLLDVNFKIINSSIDENIDLNIPLDEALKELSYQKAKKVFDFNQNSIVIGCDTVVELDGEIIQKPKDELDAFKILKKLSNKTHSVKTAICILDKEHDIRFISNSLVKFKELTDIEIDEYIKTKEPLDKAGAYGIQGRAAQFIENINGDYYGIMGLPVCLLKKHITKIFSHYSSMVK